MHPNDPHSWLQIAAAKPAVIIHAQRKRIEQEPRNYHGVPSAHIPGAGTPDRDMSELLYLSL